ncbi:MAG: ABC transporter substrate-binding protein [Desulforudis sp.]|jgi:ABC-type transport system substrate-binding protein|nr:MAG: ABC transporter substrate-binding protein [Desulforudis sp.]
MAISNSGSVERGKTLDFLAHQGAVQCDNDPLPSSSRRFNVLSKVSKKRRKSTKEVVGEPVAVLLYFMAIAVLFLGLASCSRQTSSADQIVVGIEAEPERFDPLTMKNPKNFIVSWQIFEGLLGLDKNGQITPALAESWETSDNQVWRFRIRQGVRFHDSEMFGSQSQSRVMTVEDVVESYTAFCSSAAYPAFLLMDSIKGCAEYNAGTANVVDGVRAIDDKTLEINLIKPEPFFLNRLTTAWIAIFPREAKDSRFKDSWGFNLSVGTGPYLLKSRSDTEIVLVRNPNYWDKSQHGGIVRLTFRVIKNDQVRLAELKKGGIDMMLLPPSLFPAALDPYGSLKNDIAAKFQMKVFATFNSHLLGINDLKITDQHLRLAMSYGTNRKQIVDKFFYGYADVIGGAVPPGMSGYVPAISPETLFNLEKARDELSRSSYRGEPLELFVHEQAVSEQIGQLFQSQMKTIGINIQLTKLDFNSVIGRIVKGDAPMFSMFFDYVLSSPEPILINLFSSTKRPVPNFWQFTDPLIDSELEGLRALSHEASVEKSAEIEKEIMEQAPAIFLFRLKQVILYSKKYGELSVNPHGYFRFSELSSAES